jgi:hypothetical protein
MVKSTYPIRLQRNQISWKRCGRKQYSNGAEALQLVRVPGQGYSKSAPQLSRSVAARFTLDAELDKKEAPSMLQIALEAMKIAPPCSNFHQKVNAQSFLCPGQGNSKSAGQLSRSFAAR